MRIAQVMAGAVNGGAELFYERLTVALAEAATVLPVIRADARRAARLRAAGLAPVQCRFGGPLDIFTRPQIRRALKQFRADIAIAWMSRAAAHLPRDKAWTNIGRLGGYYDLKYFKSCQYLVGNTRGIVDWIIGQNVPPARVRHLPNFVDDFGNTEAVSRASLGVPEDAKLMLGLGRLHPVKGFDTLIQAASLLPDTYCLIAGEGPERARLQALIDGLGLANRVMLLGWREDSGALLKAADIFVSSSRHEPLGNMVLEAFSAQTPVLAAKSEGPAELIRNGEDGLLVPIDDPAALADAARTMLNDVRLRVKLALAARLRFSGEFSRDVVLAAWLDFLQGAKT